jgi:hypothetical protein
MSYTCFTEQIWQNSPNALNQSKLIPKSHMQASENAIVSTVVCRGKYNVSFIGHAREGPGVADWRGPLEPMSNIRHKNVKKGQLSLDI